MESLQLPDDGAHLVDWVLEVRDLLLKAASAPANKTSAFLPVSKVCSILDSCYEILKKEPSLIQVPIQEVENCTVTVVGDTHGQYHDVVRLIEVAGTPSPSSKFIFNGDFVDRGAWGLETLLWLVCWKIALPTSVFLLRGNHESSTCTSLYGFKDELIAKYFAPKDHKGVYKACKKLFSALPLGALIANSTLVLHGGLFRKSPPTTSRGKKKKRKKDAEVYDCYSLPLDLGGLEDLKKAAKGGVDPDGFGTSILASDVMWSDPVMVPGLNLNDQRGIGLVFGPDVTQAFLEQNKLKLVIRSHEGPDARDKRTDMHHMLEGYTIDHDVPAGKLMTVFSAPDYPQFQEGDRFHNKAAVAVLSAPDYATPQMKQFEAVLPRPAAAPYYDYISVPDSDEDIGLTGNGCHSDMSDASHLEDEELDATEDDKDVGAATGPVTAQPSNAPPQENGKQIKDQTFTNGHIVHEADVCMVDANHAENGHRVEGDAGAGAAVGAEENGSHAGAAGPAATDATECELPGRPPLHPQDAQLPEQTPAASAKLGSRAFLASPAKWTAPRSLNKATPNGGACEDGEDDRELRPRRLLGSSTPQGSEQPPAVT